MIALGVGHGSSGFAQHVIGIPVALLLGLARSADRPFDGLAEHEVAAQHPHRLQDRLTDHGFAQPMHEAGKARPDFTFILRVDPDEAPGQHQAPGRSIDEQGLAVTEMALPVAKAELVADQAVGGLRIRDAEQSLGEAHQHDALAGAERIFVEERLDSELIASGLAHPLGQAARPSQDSQLLLGPDGGLRHQGRNAGGLIGAVRLANRRPQRIVTEWRPVGQNTGSHRAISLATGSLVSGSRHRTGWPHHSCRGRW